MKSDRPWLVTGGAGFLGSHVVEQLLAHAVPVVVVDDLSTGSRDYLLPHQGRPGFTLSEMDIRDTHRLSVLVKQYDAIAVVHLAALHFIPAAVADPTRTVSLNVLGTQSVLTACRSAGVERFWFASTGDVYAPSATAHREEDLLTPFNIYGLSKLMGEQLVALEARQQPATRFLIGRLFNLYGVRETNPHILPEILNS